MGLLSFDWNGNYGSPAQQRIFPTQPLPDAAPPADSKQALADAIARAERAEALILRSYELTLQAQRIAADAQEQLARLRAWLGACPESSQMGNQ